MKTFISLLMLFIIVNLYSQSEIDFIHQVVEKYESQKSIHYDIFYSAKYFDSEKPTVAPGKVSKIRKNTDSIFGGSFLYHYELNLNDTLKSFTKFYDLNNIFVFEHNKRKITKFNAKKGEIGTITSAYDGNFIKTYFTDPERILQKIENKENNIKFESSPDELILYIHFPDDKEDQFFDMVETIFFDKKEMIIHKILYKAHWKDQIQENEWKLSNIKFDETDSQTLQNQTAKYFDTYQMKTYEPQTASYYELMAINEEAPNLNGFIFPDYFNEKDINFDKLTIVDFWYTACFPCIKTIPQLNKLKEKYGDNINIIGVNDVEHKTEQQGKIEAFLKKVPVGYKILLTKTIPKEYNIKVYPTIYIIGEDGNVKFSQAGYSEENFKELDKIIDYLLNQ